MDENNKSAVEEVQPNQPRKPQNLQNSPAVQQERKVAIGTAIAKHNFSKYVRDGLKSMMKNERKTMKEWEKFFSDQGVI
jgi:hypoxanthine phosphoribosyltransferase